MSLLCAHKSCKEVAAHLSLSPRTVEHVIERLKARFRKTTLHGLLAAVSRDLHEPSNS